MVLPIMLIYLMLDEMLEIAMALATPIADFLWLGGADEIETPRLVAIVLIVLVSFLTGLSMRTRTGRQLGGWLERTFLEPIPGYVVIKSLTRRIGGEELDERFRPALLTMPLGGWAIVFIVEDHGNGYYTVFLPSTPTPAAGTVQVVKQDRLRKLDVPVGRVLETFFHWGIGTRAILPAFDEFPRTKTSPPMDPT